MEAGQEISPTVIDWKLGVSVSTVAQNLTRFETKETAKERERNRDSKNQQRGKKAKTRQFPIGEQGFKVGKKPNPPVVLTVQGSPRNYSYLLSKMYSSNSVCDWGRLLEDRWQKRNGHIYTPVTEATVGTGIWYVYLKLSAAGDPESSWITNLTDIKREA